MTAAAWAATLVFSLSTPGLRLPLATTQVSTFDECEAQVRAHPEDFRCFGMIAFRTNQWDEAVRRLEAILKRNPSLHRARWALAYIEASFGRQTAIDLYRQAADGMEAEGSITGAALALSEMSGTLSRMGREEETGPVLERAEKLARRSGVEEIVSRIRVAQAWHAFHHLEYGTAETILREVETSVFSKSSEDVRGEWLSAMGAVCWATGRDSEALSWYRREADLYAKSGNRWRLAGVLYNIALAMARLDINNEKQLRDALAIAVSSGNKGIQAQVLSQLAYLAPTIEEARSMSERALAVSREIGGFDTMLQAMRHLGGSYLTEEPRDPVKGRGLLDAAREMANRRGSQYQITKSAGYDAFVSWTQAVRDPQNQVLRRKAIADGLAQLDAIEKIRDRQEDGLVRARTMGQWAPSYQSLISFILVTSDRPQPIREDLDLALHIAERLRGRTLLDEMDAAHSSDRIVRETPQVKKRSGVLQEIARVQKQLLLPSLENAERDELLARLDRLDVEEAALRASISRD